MPKFLERKLKSEYGSKSAVPYKVMTAIGAMHGNKGAAMEKRHEAHQQRISRSMARSKRHG